MAEAAFQFARELEKRGIGKGERVLLWAPNSGEWVTTFFGCALRGVIIVPIDDAGAADFAMRVSQQVAARLIVCSREHAAVVSSSSSSLLILDDIRQILAMHSPAPYPAEAIAAADTLEIVFTSGTTAEPKGVVISHGNVLGNIAPLESEMQRYLKYERLVHPVRFLNLLAAEPCLWPVSWNLPASTDGRHGDFSGRVKSGGSHSGYTAGTSVCAGCSTSHACNP